MKTEKAKNAGRAIAKGLIQWLHLMYQKDTATRVLTALIAELKAHEKDFIRKPKREV